MANANIDALYVGSLKIKKYHNSFSRNFTFYKWCVTKVAHCMMLSGHKLINMVASIREIMDTSNSCIFFIT